MVPPANVKVRAKMVFVACMLNPKTDPQIRPPQEEDQITVRFEITDVMTELQWAALLAAMKSGVLVPNFD